MSVLRLWEDSVFSTMAAKKQSEKGQALFEFLLLLPLMVIVTTLLIKVNTTTQLSIVNQQYARAQVLFLAYNSPEYPELRLRQTRRPQDVLYLGVSENLPSDRLNEGKYVPEAPSFKITRPSAPIGNNDEKTEPEIRGIIRARNNVALCTSFSERLSPASEFSYCRSPL